MTNTKHIYNLFILLVLMLVIGCFSASSALAAGIDPLVPDAKTYENGQIILNKWAERIGADEWKVNVSATIDKIPTQPPQLEVVIVLDMSNSMLGCTHEASHTAAKNGFPHDHNDDTCPLGSTCNADYIYHFDSKACYYEYKYIDEEGKEKTAKVNFAPDRYDVAVEAIGKLTSSLPADTDITRVVFSLNNDNFTFVLPENTDFNPNAHLGDFGGGTYMMKGINLGIAKFKENSTKTQVLIVVTDGESQDGYTSTALENFKGQVYTVGFNHHNANLSSIAKNGGSYFHAASAEQLDQAFAEITNELTALLIDPMGTNVAFTPSSVIQPETSLNGSVVFADNTLMWSPSSSAKFDDATIAYSYTVKLNEKADRTAGNHTGVALNNPTSLRYGPASSTADQMKSAAFPIPKATYAIATMQVKWQFGNTDLQDPTAVETIICDWTDSAFETDYKNPQQTIIKDGKTYFYTDTKITLNGSEHDHLDGLIDPGAYVVTHYYSDEQPKPKYAVTYEYTGSVPPGAPAASSFNTESTAGNTITVAANPSVANWTFSGWSIAEGGATITDGQFTMPANNVKLVGNWTERAKATVTVRYVDDQGNTLQESVSVTEYVGDPYDVSEAMNVPNITIGDTIYEWYSCDNENSYQGTIPEGGLVITHYYKERAKASITVHYVDDQGNTLLSDYVIPPQYVGVQYNLSENVKVPTITTEDGKVYKFDSDDGAAYSGYLTQNVEITRVYERLSSAVVVEYVKENGEALQDPTMSTVFVGEPYNVTSTQNITTITKDNKIYDYDKDKESKNYSGTMSEGTIVITRVYKERAKARVAVHFHTDDDPPIALQGSIYSEPLYVGAEYDVTDTQIPSLSGSGKIYDFVYDNGVAYKGTMPERGAEIIRTYKRRRAPVTVHYVDKDGNALQAPTTSTVFVGDPYDVSAAAAVATITTEDGKIYNFDSDDNAVYTGTMPDGGLTITRVYARSSATATVTVYYVKENGNALHTPTTSNVLIGDPYDVSAAAAVTTITVDGVIYDFLADGDAEYTGKMPNSNVTILRIYTERDKATVTVNYYIIEDEEVPLQDAFSLTTYIDTDYAVPASAQPNTIVKDKIPYDFVSDDTDNTKTYSGKMPKGGVTINRLYKERGMAAVTVKFVDGDGLELRANISASQYIGNTYDASATKSFTTITTEDGKIYDFVSDGDAAYTGELTADGVTITRVYKERGTAEAIVKFVDENGNPLKESISDSQYIGNPYDVSSAKEISSIALGDATYTFVSDDNAEYTGEMPEEGLTITRVYKKVLYYYQVHYVYTGHDAGNQEFYTNTITTPVSSTTSAQYTFYTEATRSLDGMDFWLLGTQMRSGDLSSSTAEAPYVFEIHYEYHEPPVEPDLPETGDEGMGKWITLLMASIAGMVATIRSRQKASKRS